ncbi:MAG: hypothetical protein PQJ58_18065 [Spirochaetales bacterium]|nr:hypothetical protein [Spirochaetales bacterium]
MKKILLTVLMLSILIPASVFAAPPSDEDVYETTVAVLSIFGLVFMSSMFGTSPEGVTMDMNMETGNSKMEFNAFSVTDFTAAMSDMLESSEDEVVFNFSQMDGVIEVDEAGNLNLDVDLEGGNVDSLVMQSEGEDIVTIEANGKSYNHLSEMLMAMDEDM